MRASRQPQGIAIRRRPGVPVLLPLVLAAALTCSAAMRSGAQSLDREPGTHAARIPAKVLAVPSGVSPELQQLIAAPVNPDWNTRWSTGEQWRRAADALAAKSAPERLAMRQRQVASRLPGFTAE